MEELFDPRLSRHPFTSTISGPSNAGKTHLIYRILRDWSNCTVGGGFGIKITNPYTMDGRRIFAKEYQKMRRKGNTFKIDSDIHIS